MVDYRTLGFSSLEDYKNTFKDKLLDTVHTYEFFVDWKKVDSYVNEHFIEFGLLNTLTNFKYEDRKNKLMEILKKYPKCIQVIPSLLAVREKNIAVADITDQIIKGTILYNFENNNPTQNDIDKIVDFCDKTGIIKLFDSVKDVYTYMKGIEVGLDSNARKNRSGEVFSSLIRSLLDSVTDNLVKQGLNFSYKKEIELQDYIKYPKQKKVDFVIFYNVKPLLIIEVNIYHGPGSKPNEIVRAYTDLQNELRSISQNFLWITDGPGWKKMMPQFEEACNSIDYIFNLWLSYNKLEDLLKKLI